ncbi:Fic family protein [Kitasatospora cineracea]|uniref:Fic family protein n=1 Tax=Kitasatospora cineracea TaxID=88074 RepID=UPI0033FB4383
MQTELCLTNWRLGQTMAERLCAGILRLSGYTDVEPQAPLGGGDGKKDLIVRRGGKKYVGAVYFPTTPISYADVTRKYKSDLPGVAANDADGFVFLVNQHLTVGQRSALLALGDPQTDEIFNVERMRAVLDDPRGYGLRLEFLRIPMSQEEQVAFFSTTEHDRIQRAVEHEIAGTGEQTRLPVTARLDTALLQMLHRALMGDRYSAPTAGLPRTRETWLAGGDGKVLRRFTAPEDIPEALHTLLAHWQALYADVVAADRERVLHALAWFHHGLVSIAPFTDANGRLARLIIDQAARELCRRGIAADLVTDPIAYHEALRAADRGDLAPLIELVRAALV